MRRLPASLLRRLVAGFGWVALVAAAVGAVNGGQPAALGAALLILVALAALAEPKRGVGLLAAIAAAIVFAADSSVRAALGRRGLPDGLDVAALAVTIPALLGTPLALRVIRNELGALLSRLDEQTTLIDELTVVDASTGAFRPRYIDTILPEEIDRARRYHRSLTLALVAVDGWPAIVRERGEVGAHALTGRIVEQLSLGTRTVDKIVQLGDGEFALVLPETPLEGAEIVAGRVQASASDAAGVLLRVGLANFPRDAVLSASLLEEARDALEYARTAELLVVDRTLLGHGAL